MAHSFFDLLFDFEQGGVQRGCLVSDFWEVGNMGCAAICRECAKHRVRLVFNRNAVLHVFFVATTDGTYLARGEMTFLPMGFNLKAFGYILTNPRFNVFAGMRNSFLYTALGTLLAVACTYVTAYVLSRPRFKHRYALMSLFIITWVFDAGIIPQYIIYNQFGFVNNPWVMIVPGAINTQFLIITKTFLEGIPNELEEAAFVDGASDIKILTRVFLPLSPTVLATTGLFYAVSIWNQYLLPQIYLKDDAIKTIQQVLKSVVITDGSSGTTFKNVVLDGVTLNQQNLKAAAIFIAMLPIKAQGFGKVIVLVNSSNAMELGFLEDDAIDAALWIGSLGSTGFNAVGEILSGKVNPSSRLSDTYAYDLTSSPAYWNAGDFTYSNLDHHYVEYAEGIYVGYRFYETRYVDNTTGICDEAAYAKAVQYPFGYGLSYTTFAYSDLQVNADTVTFTLTNTGSCAGAEVAQLYVAKPDAKVFRPAKELKGFVKVFLQPGESKSVTIPLDDKTFRYWNVTTDRWEVEGGSYQLLVGSNVQDIRLTAEIALPGTGAPDPYAGKELEHYRTAHVQEVPDAEFEALLGRPLPEETTAIDRTMTLGELHHSRSPLCWLIAGVLTLLVRSGEKRGKPNLNILFQYNMPLRGLAQMTGGIIGEETVDGLVLEAKGFWGIGILRALVGLVQNAVANSRYQAKLDEQSR